MFLADCHNLTAFVCVCLHLHAPPFDTSPLCEPLRQVKKGLRRNGVHLQPLPGGHFCGSDLAASHFTLLLLLPSRDCYASFECEYIGKKPKVTAGGGRQKRNVTTIHDISQFTTFYQNFRLFLPMSTRHKSS